MSNNEDTYIFSPQHDCWAVKWHGQVMPTKFSHQNPAIEYLAQLRNVRSRNQRAENTTSAIELGVLLRAVEALEAVRKLDMPGPLYMQTLKSFSEMSYYTQQILATKVEVV